MTANSLRPGLALLILFAGHFFASAFMRNLGYGLDAIQHPGVAQFAGWVYAGFTAGSHWLGPPLFLFVLYLVWRVWRGEPVQTGIDIIGGFLCLRCAMIFIMLNLLLLSQLRAGALLLTQLLLFLPVITLNFGWLYWRLDMGARAKGSQQIKFAEDDAAPRVFDYFYIATRTLMQFEPTGAEARSRAMKALFVLHGIMMLDLMALTLSRAIALASGD